MENLNGASFFATGGSQIALGLDLRYIPGGGGKSFRFQSRFATKLLGCQKGF